MRVSVLTPVGAGRGAWLHAAGASVGRSRTAAARVGVELEWVVCTDGAPAPLPADDPPDRVVAWRAPRGVSSARNAALAAATGDWVIPLDADDELDADGVAEVLGRLVGDDTVGWVGANRLRLGGGRTPHWFDSGRDLDAGELATLWSSPFLFHPNCWLVRREVALACGGWSAVGPNEDLAAVLAASEESPGRLDPAVLLHYRVWDGQQVAAGSYVEDKPAAFAVIEAMINARRRRAGRAPISPPAAGPAHGRTFVPADAGR